MDVEGSEADADLLQVPVHVQKGDDVAGRAAVGVLEYTFHVLLHRHGRGGGAVEVGDDGGASSSS